jgi:hypothetical protein
MGKIIKFDPSRRRSRSGKSWTRPEDYGAPPPPPPPREPRGPDGARVLARLTVAALIAITAAWSLADLL